MTDTLGYMEQKKDRFLNEWNPKKILSNEFAPKKDMSFLSCWKRYKTEKNECTNSKSAGNFAKINTTWENDL